MIDDPVVEEIRKQRDIHAARYKYDLKAIFDALVKREKNSLRPVVNRPPRRLPATVKTNNLSPLDQSRPTAPV